MSPPSPQESFERSSLQHSPEKNKLTYTQPKSKRQMFEFVKTQRNKTFKKKTTILSQIPPCLIWDRNGLPTTSEVQRLVWPHWPRVMWNRSCRSRVGAPPWPISLIWFGFRAAEDSGVEQWTLWRSYHVQNLRRCSTEVMSHYTSIPKSLPSNLLSSMLHLILGSNTIVSLC